MTDTLKRMNDAISFVGESLIHDEDNSGWHFTQGPDVNIVTIPATVKQLFNESELLAQIQSSFGNGVIITEKEMILYVEDEASKVIPFENVDYIASIAAVKDDTEESNEIGTPGLLKMTESMSLMTNMFQSSSDSDKSITLQMSDGTTQYIEYPELEDDNWGLNVAAIYGVIHAYMKRGPLMLADVNENFKKLFMDALTKEDHYGSINFTFDDAADWVSFTNGSGSGFTNSGMQLDFVIGPDSLATFGYVLLFESNQPIYVTRTALNNDVYHVPFDEISYIDAEYSQGSFWRGTSDSANVTVVTDEDEIELINDSFVEFDDGKLVEIIEAAIDFIKDQSK